MKDEFEIYLRKYSEIYKVKKGEDSIYQILCLKGNFIQPYSIRSQLLLFSFSGGKSARAKNVLKGKLKELGIWHKIIQEGDLNMIIIFKEVNLDKVASLFKIRKRKRYSPEYRKKLVERAKNMQNVQVWL